MVTESTLVVARDCTRVGTWEGLLHGYGVIKIFGD